MDTIDIVKSDTIIIIENENENEKQMQNEKQKQNENLIKHLPTRYERLKGIMFKQLKESGYSWKINCILLPYNIYLTYLFRPHGKSKSTGDYVVYEVMFLWGFFPILTWFCEGFARYTIGRLTGITSAITNAIMNGIMVLLGIISYATWIRYVDDDTRSIISEIPIKIAISLFEISFTIGASFILFFITIEEQKKIYFPFNLIINKEEKIAWDLIVESWKVQTQQNSIGRLLSQWFGIDNVAITFGLLYLTIKSFLSISLTVYAIIYNKDPIDF